MCLKPLYPRGGSEPDGGQRGGERKDGIVQGVDALYGTKVLAGTCGGAALALAGLSQGNHCGSGPFYRPGYDRLEDMLSALGRISAGSNHGISPKEYEDAKRTEGPRGKKP